MEAIIQRENLTDYMMISTDNLQYLHFLEAEISNLEHVIATMPGHVYWKDANGIYLGCNDAQAKSLGFNSGKDIVGKTDKDLPWAEEADFLAEVDQHVMATAEIYIIEEPVTLPDGHEAIFLSQKVPLYDHLGRIIGIIGISFNITEQKQLEQAKVHLRQVEERIEAMRTLAATIAHELRTPLASIKQGVQGLSTVLPELIATYKKAQQAGLVTKPLRKSHLAKLENLSENIDRQINHANTYIDMSLLNLSLSGIDTSKFSTHSMVTVIHQALDKYPYKPGEQALIDLNLNDDFTFHGDNILTTHVLFNLIKNALYFIEQTRKGQIFLGISEIEAYNILHVKDTSKGIPREELPHIFERFYSKRNGGTGVGLAFCKLVMESFQGKITCLSELNQFTEFRLFFPK